MAYRIFTGALEDNADRINLITAGNGDSITFTRSAIYTAFGTGSHVVSVRRGVNLAIDGQLASGSGATVSGGSGTGAAAVRVGQYGAVTSAGGAAFDIGGASLRLYNGGEISGAVGILSRTILTTITNTGSIAGENAISITSDSSVIDNSGAIVGGIRGIRIIGEESQQITNSGIISGQEGTGVDVNAGGAILITNSGTISGNIGVNLDTFAGSEAEERTIVNTGTIAGLLTAVFGSADGDTLRNAGLISGDVNLFGGDDVYDGSGGMVAGDVLGGGGIDSLTGGAAREVLDGGDGDDTLAGGGGDDVLIGSRGGDLLDGGEGRDIASYRNETAGLTLSLGDGSGRGDGSDTFESIEGLEGGSGSDALSGTDGRDWLYGGAGDDVLVGQGGRDAFFGGLGNDTYWVDGVAGSPADDRVVERPGEGIDIALAFGSYTLPDNVENMLIQAFFVADGTGNGLANAITGSQAENVIDGLGGNDTLTGRGGNDVFRFSTTLNPGNVDTITDFVSGADDLSLRQAIFTALPFGALAGKAFFVGTQAADTFDRIIYNPATGALFYDPDGTGGQAQIQFAVVSGTAPVLADFIVQ